MDKKVNEPATEIAGKLTKVTINGQETEVPQGITVLQACEMQGIEIPRFCYHDRLSIAGNCRMCLVEVSPGPKKPQASCALPVSENMNIKTHSPMAVNARKSVMEFLLINHPLDCPICDQGGECDLQDQALAFGKGKSDYNFQKRAVTNKQMGPFIDTIMTRCIHCTRCVRFATEIAGVEEIGMLGRSDQAEITTLEQAVTSELSGNLIDICPVGALTSRPYAFTARPWELRRTAAIDIHDAVGTNIVVQTSGNDIMRTLPRNNPAVNEEWLSDKGRFGQDGLKYNRLDRPYLKRNGQTQEVDWETAIKKTSEMLKSKRVGIIAGPELSLEEQYAVLKLSESVKAKHLDGCLDQDTSLAFLADEASAAWRFNTPIAELENADHILLVGCNPRREAPLVHTRLRYAWTHNHADIDLLGTEVDLGLKYNYLGKDPRILDSLVSGDHPSFKKLAKAKNGIIILGIEALKRSDRLVVLRAASEIAAKTNNLRGFNLLSRTPAPIGALTLGLTGPEDSMSATEMLDEETIKELDCLVMVGTNPPAGWQKPKGCKTKLVVIASHGENAISEADVILPAACSVEKDGLYMNLEGRIQNSTRAVFPPGEAKEIWKIMRALYAEHKTTSSKSASAKDGLPFNNLFNNLAELRSEMFAQFPKTKIHNTPQEGQWDKIGRAGRILSSPWEEPMPQYFRSNAIARSSKVLRDAELKLTMKLKNT